jgi:hypothetical protein
MTYIKDSQGEDVQCEECEMYPAEFEWRDPMTGEGKSICIECRQDKRTEDVEHA